MLFVLQFIHIASRSSVSFTISPSTAAPNSGLPHFCLSPSVTCYDCACAGLMSQSPSRLPCSIWLGICLPTPSPPALGGPFTGGTSPRRLSGVKKMHKVSLIVASMAQFCVQHVFALVPSRFVHVSKGLHEWSTAQHGTHMVMLGSSYIGNRHHLLIALQRFT